MKKLLIAGAAVIAILFMLHACDQHTEQVVAQAQPAPQVVQAASPVVVQQSNDGFWQGVMLGHMFSGGNTTVVHHYDHGPAYVAPRRSTVVNNTTIVNKTYVRPAPMPSAPRTTYSAPRATSYAGSYSARSSYSSYSSRSSYSGFSSRR